MIEHAPSTEFESEFNSRLRALYTKLELRHSWIRGLFRTLTRNEQDIDGMVNETLHKYLRDVGGTLWVTGGIDLPPLEPLVEDGELSGFTLRAIGPATPIRDIEKYTFTYPDAWFRSVARSVLKDHARKRKAEKEHLVAVNRAVEFPTRRNGQPQHIRPSWVVEKLYHSPRNVEQWLVLQVRNFEIRECYVAALKKLGPVQRAAWILCQDELLTSKEAERLLIPTVHWRTTRAAFGTMPMQDAEASRLLDRADISSDLSRARAILAKLLADMNPGNAWNIPAQKFSREFLVGSARSGSARAIRPWICSTREDLVIAARDKFFILRLPPRYLSRSGFEPDLEARA
jgi:DNA-directed RNA polymerase specialized sigma24 family protein